MLSVDQIKLLESKVLKAVDSIKELSAENKSLKTELEVRDKRISELENLILAFRDDQSRIEQGILNALNQLSIFEETVNEKISAVKSETKKSDLAVEAASPSFISQKETAPKINDDAVTSETDTAESSSLQSEPEPPLSSGDTQKASSTAENSAPVDENQLDIF